MQSEGAYEPQAGQGPPRKPAPAAPHATTSPGLAALITSPLAPSPPAPALTSPSAQMPFLPGACRLPRLLQLDGHGPKTPSFPLFNTHFLPPKPLPLHLFSSPILPGTWIQPGIRLAQPSEG